MLRFCTGSALIFFSLLSAASADEPTWGHFKAKFVVDLKVPIPAPAQIPIPAGVACGAVAPVNESLIVSKEGGLKNVVVYLRKPAGKDLPVHKDYDPKAKVDLDNAGCRFEPHIATLWNARTLHVTNNDKFGHNTKIDLFNQAGVNPIVPPGGFVDLDFKMAENSPCPVACNIHPWMAAHVLILDHPYMAVSNADGIVELKNIPAGEWEFVAWHERGGYIKKPVIEGKEVTWNKGRFPVTITAEKVTDLGQATVTPK